MNPSPKNEPESIRSDIDVTRRRMDSTMDALGERLQPRHLLDEVLGFFRGSTREGESRMTNIREKVSRSADTAAHAIADTVKNNPMPLLLIGAGAAWLIYESQRDKSLFYDEESGTYTKRRRDDERRYDPDTHYDRPLQYPSASGSEMASEASSKFGEMTEKIGEKTSTAAAQVKEKLSNVTDTAREKLHAVKERAGAMTSQISETTRQSYNKARDRVVDTANEHPLEVGLVALAAGLMAGLALPTPQAVNRTVGPAADRLRARTREAGSEMIEKGKRVAEAAASAVKEEAKAQGLTPERLREKAGALGEHAQEAAGEMAHRTGLAPTGNPPGAQPNDPSVARPAV